MKITAQELLTRYKRLVDINENNERLIVRQVEWIQHQNSELQDRTEKLAEEKQKVKRLEAEILRLKSVNSNINNYLF